MKVKKNVKRKSIIKMTIILIMLAVVTFLGVNGLKYDNGNYEIKSYGSSIKRGLDLQGGTVVLFQVGGTTGIGSGSAVDNTTTDASETEGQLIDRTIVLINERLNPDGVSEITVTKEGTDRIRVEIPGQYDSQNAVETLTKTGELTFTDPSGNVILTGADVKNATAGVDNSVGLSSPIVRLEFNSEGATKFAQATASLVGQTIAINLDGEAISKPTVQAAISGGEASITGLESAEEAQRIASVIQSGALPVKLNYLSTQTIGATLGNDALPQAVKAGIIGLSIIFLFMIVFYRSAGIFSDISLYVYVILTLFIYVSLGIVLTLPGIAAFILTVGMAVDANILIFERINEELVTGKTIKSSTDLGFKRAMSSIVDSNVTTIVAGIILYIFGSGSVKGFAVTLVIGIISSMFVALVFTKYFLNRGIDMGFLNKANHFGAKIKVKEDVNNA